MNLSIGINKIAIINLFIRFKSLVQQRSISVLLLLFLPVTKYAHAFYSIVNIIRQGRLKLLFTVHSSQPSCSLMRLYNYHRHVPVLCVHIEDVFYFSFDIFVEL